MKKFVAYAAVLLAVSFPTLVLAWGRPCNYGWYGGPHISYFGGGGFFMWIVTIILLALLAFFGIRLFKMRTFEPGRKESSLDILKARYARGEITKEQFDVMKRDLGE